MTDLEMTKLCAEAMGFKWRQYQNNGIAWLEALGVGKKYQPLHDDAQAMALVKCFRLSLQGGYDGGALLESEKSWIVEHNDGEQANIATYAYLNRAIVECVAKMQASA